MGGLKLINETDQDIILCEGTGGVYRPIKIIPKGKKLVLKVDRNETYREYRCGFPSEALREKEAVVLTSDDIAEYTHVTIKWDQKTKKLSCETKKQSESNAATDEPSGQASSSLVRWLVNKLGWKKELSPNGEEAGGRGGGDGGDGRGGGAEGAREAVNGGGGNNDANVPRHGGSVDSFALTLSSSV